LFWTPVINGIVAVPLMIVMMIMTMQPRSWAPLYAAGRSGCGMGIDRRNGFAVAIMFATWGG